MKLIAAIAVLMCFYMFRAAWFVDWGTLKRQCAWCGKRLGGNPWAKRITHGICPRCAARLINPKDLKD